MLLRTNPQSVKNNKTQPIHSSKESGPMFPLYFHSGSPAPVKAIPCNLMANVTVGNQMELCFPNISESALPSHAVIWAVSGRYDHSEAKA